MPPAARSPALVVPLVNGNVSVTIDVASCAFGEFVIDWGPGLRVYLTKAGDSLILLLGGGTKGTQFEDIRRAMAMNREYRERKRSRTGEA